MALSAGAVVAQFDGDFKGLNKGLKDAEKNVNGFISGIEDAGKKVTKNLNSISDVSKKVGGAISLYLTAPLAAAMGLVSAQAINQVKQVQNASAGLRAYEKDASKVSATLQELIQYAQSDTGVLFQRQDLFDAASTLKLFGSETEDLVPRVKILSKAVSMGKTTFQELSQIVGRVGATGKLTAVDFDMLIERGIGLDKSMRGTDISAQALFESLDKALPAELLEGRAKTIEGQMIRLQSAIRNIGHVILGTNKDVDGFMPNSLGERIFKAGEQIRQFVRSAEFLEIAKQVGDRLVVAFDAIVNVVTRLYNWFIALSPQQRKLITDIVLLTAALGPLLVFFAGFIKLISFVVGPIVAVIKVLSFLAGIFWGINSVTLTVALGIVKLMGFISTLALVVNPITGIFVAMGVALAGVAFLIIRNWEQVKSKFRDVVSGISNSVTNISNSIKDGFRKAIDYVNNLISKWNPLNKVSGLVSGITNALKGKIPGFADGVRNFSGGLAVVGERGPELVNLPKGADVFTNEESRRMTAGNGGITIENMNIRSGIDWELGAQYMAQKLRLS